MRGEASGPLIGHSALPERTALRACPRGESGRRLVGVIELADAALEAWLATLDPPVEVSFERSEAASGERPVLVLALGAIREQTDKRDNRVTDVREGERVVERRRAMRFFELDYHCTVSGPARRAHRALGDVVQLVVDHDVVPAEHIPAELAAIGVPLDVQLVAAPSGTAAVVLRVVVPVEPAPQREIAPPATALHLDMGPPPTPGSAREPVTGADVTVVPDVPIEERRWTTVRRRELVTRPQVS